MKRHDRNAIVWLVVAFTWLTLLCIVDESTPFRVVFEVLSGGGLITALKVESWS